MPYSDPSLQPKPSSAPPPRKRRRRFWRAIRWLLLLLMIGGLAMVGLRQYRLHVAEKRLAEVVAELDRTDPGWRFEDCTINRPPVPDDQNGALVVIEMKKQLPEDWAKKLKVKMPNPLGGDAWEQDLDKIVSTIGISERLPEEGLKVLRAELANWQAALATARRLKDYETGQYPVEWDRDNPTATLLLDIQDARGAARLLGWDIELACEDLHNERVVPTLKAMLAVGRTIGDRPCLIEYLIRMAAEITTVRQIERVIALVELSDAHLAEITKHLELQHESELFLAALRTERAFGSTLSAAILDGRMSLDTLGNTGPQKTRGWEQVQWWYMKPKFIDSASNYLIYITRVIDSAHLPRRDRVVAWEAIEEEVKAAKHGLIENSLARIILPALIKVANAEARCEANLSLARVAIALELYRREHGKWPDALDEVAPKYLAQIPIDPFDRDGNAMRYRKTDDGVVVYSIGPDETDDEGFEDREAGRIPGNDITFRLYDPEHRRKPPAKLE